MGTRFCGKPPIVRIERRSCAGRCRNLGQVAGSVSKMKVFSVLFLTRATCATTIVAAPRVTWGRIRALSASSGAGFRAGASDVTHRHRSLGRVASKAPPGGAAARAARGGAAPWPQQSPPALRLLRAGPMALRPLPGAQARTSRRPKFVAGSGSRLTAHGLNPYVRVVES